MAENKELKDTELDKVIGGKSYPEEPDSDPDIPVLENLTDNKGADE